MKVSEVVKILHYLGFHFDRATGSHRIYKKPGMNGMPPTVPAHAGDVGDKDLKSIWRQAGVSEVFKGVRGNVSNYIEAIDAFAARTCLKAADIGVAESGDFHTEKNRSAYAEQPRNFHP